MHLISIHRHSICLLKIIDTRTLIKFEGKIVTFKRVHADYVCCACTDTSFNGDKQLADWLECAAVGRITLLADGPRLSSPQFSGKIAPKDNGIRNSISRTNHYVRAARRPSIMRSVEWNKCGNGTEALREID